MYDNSIPGYNFLHRVNDIHNYNQSARNNGIIAEQIE
jgi:hypothetical protein